MLNKNHRRCGCFAISQVFFKKHLFCNCSPCCLAILMSHATNRSETIHDFIYCTLPPCNPPPHRRPPRLGARCQRETPRPLKSNAIFAGRVHRRKLGAHRNIAVAALHLHLHLPIAGSETATDTKNADDNKETKKIECSKDTKETEYIEAPHNSSFLCTLRPTQWCSPLA